MLALLGGAPAHAAHLGAVAGLPDAGATLAKMAEKHLIQAQDHGYRLAGNLIAPLQQSLDLTPWGEQALKHYTSWAEQRRSAPEEIVAEADAIRRLLEWASETGRGAEGLRLARALEGALARRKRWGAWAWTLSFLTTAAQAAGDPASEAWALHQQGSLALVQGRTEAARGLLTQALELRKKMGDSAGAAVTRDNLRLLTPVPPPWIEVLTETWAVVIRRNLSFLTPASTLSQPVPRPPLRRPLWINTLAGAGALVLALLGMYFVPNPARRIGGTNTGTIPTLDCTPEVRQLS